MRVSHVLAFSGLPGSGKTTISKALAADIGWKYLSFGEYVARLAGVSPSDGSSRTVLQDIGQDSVRRSPASFVRGFLANLPPSGEQRLVLDGLRHREVLAEIRTQTGATWVAVIYVSAGPKVRLARLGERSGPSPDDHPVEGQVRELEGVANLVVDTSESIPQQAASLVKLWLRSAGVLAGT
jgi:dephospho-CoA kinase